MEIISKIKSWAAALADVGVSLIALGIVLEVLFSGQNVPFWPDISVIANVQSIIAGFSAHRFSWFSCCLGFYTQYILKNNISNIIEYIRGV